MTSRRIKLLTYWNFAKLTKRWPRKPERRIINVIAEQAVEMLKEPLSFYGFTVRVDDRVAPGDVLVIDPYPCTDPNCARWKGLVRDGKGAWRDEDIVVELCDAVAARVLKADQDSKHEEQSDWPEED